MTTDREATARHESAHAITAAACGWSVQEVSVTRSGRVNGYCKTLELSARYDPCYLLAGLVAEADYSGTTLAESADGPGANDIRLIIDKLERLFPQLEYLRDDRPAWFRDPNVEAVVSRCRNILQANAAVLDHLALLLASCGTLRGRALEPILKGVRPCPIWQAEQKIQTAERYEKMRKQNAKKIGEQRRRHPGKRGFNSFVGGFSDQDHRDKALARCGLGPDKFGSRGIAAAQKILADHKRLIAGGQ